MIWTDASLSFIGMYIKKKKATFGDIVCIGPCKGKGQGVQQLGHFGAAMEVSD